MAHAPKTGASEGPELDHLSPRVLRRQRAFSRKVSEVLKQVGPVGHMRFLAQGENRLAAQERVEDPMSYRWRLRT